MGARLDLVPHAAGARALVAADSRGDPGPRRSRHWIPRVSPGDAVRLAGDPDRRGGVDHLAGAARVAQDREPENVTPEDAPLPLIALDAVVKTYDTGEVPFTALREVNLHVHTGEFVGLIGKSGSGKTTLVNMITGIDRPTSGAVVVDGTPIHELSENELALWRGRTIGVVFQFFQLLPTLTTIENVMLPMDFANVIPSGERFDRAMHLLEQVEMADQAHKLPSALSGGQQQRVAIARALANDPPVIAADEPTGNLDSKTAEAVFTLFEELVERHKTIIMVTHDNDLAGRVRRALHVSDGEIVEERIHRARVGA
ncbi:MAG: ABC transporter ATP-binding protein [Coriobacteriales bacterium]|nr:ABC transporter ATP-binding protein [Coriobacteriales bacterium]